MKSTGSVLAVLIVVAATVGDGVERVSRPVEVLTRPGRLAATVAEPPNAPVMVGDRAPNFSWIGVDDRPRRLRDILDQANALVVFSPSDAELSQLESEREDLALMGVVPVAVVEARPRSAVIRAKRAGVHFLVVPDPVRVIGSQFNLLDAETNRTQPGWFALDRRGVVRGSGSSLSHRQGWTRIAASALAIPTPDVPLPVRTR